MKTAAPDDIWLHTKGIPGCHVIVTGVKNELPDRSLLEAATIAATLARLKVLPEFLSITRAEKTYASRTALNRGWSYMSITTR